MDPKEIVRAGYDEPIIMPAIESDLPEILALTHRAYARNVELGFRYTGATEPMESLRQSWQKERVYKLVFRQRIVGSVRLINLPEGCLEVKRLCVEPGFQKQGFGKRLLRFAEAEARKKGFSRVRLDTAKPFRSLVEWYEHQRYVVVGEIRFPDVNYDSILMEKRLSDAEAAGIKIRRFEVADLEAVLQLHREALESSGAYAGDGPWDADLADINAFYLQSGGEFLVAILDGVIVGMGALRLTGEGRAEIRRMRVRPALQRRGIGRQILQALEDCARAAGCRETRLDTTARQEAAQTFYLNAGYRITRRGLVMGEECLFFEKTL